MITVLYNIFTMHNVLPNDFYGVPSNDMSRKMIIAFSSYEVEQRNKSLKEIEMKNRLENMKR
ncbi:MAG: DUF547 domain-containing protein [Clostridium sp.]|nr:DUF547 domain-containing protein [Clostridium sp.]